MDKERQQQAIKALTTKDATLPCPRCRNTKFEVVAESVITIQENPGSFTIGGPAIPIVLVVCTNCGYITQHAQAPLGLMKVPK